MAECHFVSSAFKLPQFVKEFPSFQRVSPAGTPAIEAAALIILMIITGGGCAQKEIGAFIKDLLARAFIMNARDVRSPVRRSHRE